MGSYPRRLLTEGEEVVAEFRSHWRLLVIPAFWALVGLVIIVLTWTWLPPDEPIVDWIVTAGGIGILLNWGFRPFINWFFRLYVLTTERLIVRSGVIARRGFEIPLENINDVRFSQNILERMLRSGDLLIESAGEQGQSRFADIKDPEGFQSEIYRVRELRAAELAGAAIDPASKLEMLARLHRQGVLSDAEFEEKRRGLLDQI